MVFPPRRLIGTIRGQVMLWRFRWSLTPTLLEPLSTEATVRGFGRALLRARLDRRATGRPAHTGQDQCRCACAGRRSRLRRVQSRSALGCSDSRSARHQHGHGRLQARIRTCSTRRNAGSDGLPVQPKRRAGHDPHGFAVGDRQWSDRTRDWYERRCQCLRLWQPGKCHYWPRNSANHAQRRWRTRTRPRQVHARQSCKIHLLRLRERGAQPVRSLPRRARLRARSINGVRDGRGSCHTA